MFVFYVKQFKKYVFLTEAILLVRVAHVEQRLAHAGSGAAPARKRGVGF